MSGRAPLMLAAFLFGIGASGLLLLATAEQRSWGPFQPPAVQRVVVYDVSPSIHPPALHDLFTGIAGEALVQAVVAQATEEPAAPAAEVEPEPTPIPPLRVFGVSSNDPGVSAAASTPTPIVLRFGIAADSAPEATETPTAGETPAASPEP